MRARIAVAHMMPSKRFGTRRATDSFNALAGGGKLHDAMRAESEREISARDHAKKRSGNLSMRKRTNRCILRNAAIGKPKRRP